MTNVISEGGVTLILFSMDQLLNISLGVTNRTLLESSHCQLSADTKIVLGNVFRNFKDRFSITLILKIAFLAPSFDCFCSIDLDSGQGVLGIAGIGKSTLL